MKYPSATPVRCPACHGGARLEDCRCTDGWTCGLAIAERVYEGEPMPDLDAEGRVVVEAYLVAFEGIEAAEAQAVAA